MSAISQLIAQQQAPNIVGSAMQGLMAADQYKADQQNTEMKKQQISMAQRQLANADSEIAEKHQEKSLKFAANMAYQIRNEKDPQRRAMLYASGRNAAEQNGLDTTKWPQQYDDKTQAGLDAIFANVYGAEQIKADLSRKPQGLVNVAAGGQLVNPETGAVIFKAPERGMTDYERQRLGLEQQRIDKSGHDGNKAPSGYRWKEDGTQEFIPGGPGDPAIGQRASVPTEGERKAGSLLQRLEFSEKQLASVVAENKGAAKPSMLSETLRTVGGDAAANMATSEDRQRVESAQLDLLDAALTLGTGAAYTKEQLRGYAKSYFPQIGDKPKNVQEKQDRLKNIIEAARTAAGRAAPQQQKPDSYRVGEIIEHGGKQYRVTGGDPSDPDVEPM